MTCDDLKLLIDFNYWARDRLIDAMATISTEQFVRPLSSSFGSVRDTVAHICAAEHIWIQRLKGQKPDGSPNSNELPDVEALRTFWTNSEYQMRETIEQLGPRLVEFQLKYQDLRGHGQSDSLWQVLHHMVNHGTYHRGQITTMLRQLGGLPPQSMDLLVFYREFNSRR